MGRIATAQGGNNPTTHKCGICGEEGHYRTTCPLAQDNGGGFCLPATRPLPRKGTYKCGHCGKVGHNKRTCPTLKADPVEQKFELELSGLLTDEAQSPRSEVGTPDTIPFPEVDIATEGYTGILLDNDVFRLVGEQVLAIRDKINRDFYTGRTHFTTWEGMDKTCFHILRPVKGADIFRSADAIQVFEVDRNINEGNSQEKLCGDIRTVADILDRRGLRHRVEAHSNLKPSTLKYKYIRKEIGTPDFRYFKKSLAERAENRRREELARMER
tara:strand:- start:93 stop:905 length:813 start_codon:yes stop_codon:yes gene_type:complete